MDRDRFALVLGAIVDLIAVGAVTLLAVRQLLPREVVVAFLTAFFAARGLGRGGGPGAPPALGGGRGSATPPGSPASPGEHGWTSSSAVAQLAALAFPRPAAR